MAFETPIKTVKTSMPECETMMMKPVSDPVSKSNPIPVPPPLEINFKEMLMRHKASNDGKKMILKAGPPVKRVNKTVLRDLAAKTWKVAPPKSIFKKRPLSERESIHGWWC